MTRRVSRSGVSITVGGIAIAIHDPEESGDILVTPGFPSHRIYLSTHVINITFIRTHSLGSEGIHNFVKGVPGLVQLACWGSPISQRDFKPAIEQLLLASVSARLFTWLYSPLYAVCLAFDAPVYPFSSWQRVR